MGAVAAFFVARPVANQDQQTASTSMASGQADNYKSSSPLEAIPNGVPRAEAEELTPAPKHSSKSKAKGAKKKSNRNRKADVYKISKLLKPILKKCTPRDFMAPGHPVWYSMTVSLSVGNGKIRAKKVTVKPTHTDPEKVNFRNDYERVVTAADLDARVTRMTACLKSSIGKFQIPADSEQKNASGSVKYSMGHDGVPYGI
jgi:hypothetical protein